MGPRGVIPLMRLALEPSYLQIPVIEVTRDLHFLPRLISSTTLSSVCSGLRVTIRTKNLQIRHRVVVRISVDVINLKR